jgi:asparagine synthase (glutamine-hydrolysing)
VCGIGAIAGLSQQRVPHARRALQGMNDLLAHRGPDGEGLWVHEAGHVGFAHRRLSIIGLERGDQPMSDESGNWITFNGEIYNYIELRAELGASRFRTDSDTEVILRAYERWGEDCVSHLRGMFAFVLWDERRRSVFVARDRFGIKPLYHAVVDGVFYAASEIKALLPFVQRLETNNDALKDYLTFQFVLAGKTLFTGVDELLPGHCLTIRDGAVLTRKYWEVLYEPDVDHSDTYFTERLRELVVDSVQYHLRADVPVGAYLSGGLDSSLLTALAARERAGESFMAFSGRFGDGGPYDESAYARELARAEGVELHEVSIGPEDFIESIADVVYHLDFPVAGPGSFPQYMVSRLAAEHRKVVLGGQGGDEVFGGYARYLLAYFEQCIKAAIDGTIDRGNFIVTYESIIPNLATLREYRPLIQEFWREGVFGDLDERYFRLVSRSPAADSAIDWTALGDYSPLETFLSIFRADNVGPNSYFDRMTHFDFKTLLPALLQVEDRVSMAHGLESRTPFVDHRVVEFAATLPAMAKFRNGELKHALRRAFADVLPPSIVERKDKMGFPVPLTEWVRGPVREFVLDTFATGAGRRDYLTSNFDVANLLEGERGFGRELWGLLSLELWQQSFHDRAGAWRRLGDELTAVAPDDRAVIAVPPS